MQRGLDRGAGLQDRLRQVEGLTLCSRCFLPVRQVQTFVHSCVHRHRSHDCMQTHCPLVVILWWWLLLSVVIRKKKLTWRVWWLIICTEVWTGRGLVIKVMFDRHIHFFIKNPLIKQLTFLFSLPKWQNVCSPELCCVIRHTDSCTPH